MADATFLACVCSWTAPTGQHAAAPIGQTGVRAWVRHPHTHAQNSSRRLDVVESKRWYRLLVFLYCTALSSAESGVETSQFALCRPSFPHTTGTNLRQRTNTEKCRRATIPPRRNPERRNGVFAILAAEAPVHRANAPGHWMPGHRRVGRRVAFSAGIGVGKFQFALSWEDQKLSSAKLSSAQIARTPPEEGRNNDTPPRRQLALAACRLRPGCLSSHIPFRFCVLETTARTVARPPPPVAEEVEHTSS